MARKLRLETEGGVYHVINRGNYRGDIFRTDKARAAFLTCVGEACQKTGWRVYAWCVMSNHNTTVTNRWLGETMRMGNLHEVSRKVRAWLRTPDVRGRNGVTTNPMV
jgi:hypothetical protein